jgi:hypothetical protein
LSPTNPPIPTSPPPPTSEPITVECKSSQKIEFGEIIQGSIDSVGEVDTCTFEANRGDIILITLTSTTNYFLPKLTVYDSDKTEICRTEFTVIPKKEGKCTIPQSGLYQIAVEDDSPTGTGIGTYIFSLTR